MGIGSGSGSFFLSNNNDPRNAYPKVNYYNSPWSKSNYPSYVTGDLRKLLESHNCYGRTLSIKSANELINNWNYYCVKLKKPYCMID